MITTELDEAIYPVTGKEIPELCPGFSIGFRVCGSVTLCYMWENRKLRIGTANCALREEFSQIRGEKIALERAMSQFGFGTLMRTTIWDHYLFGAGIIPHPTMHVLLYRGAMRQIE